MEAGALGSKINIVYDSVCLAIQFLSQSILLWKVRETRKAAAKNRNICSYWDLNTSSPTRKPSEIARQKQVTFLITTVVMGNQR